jgi:uncharacterized membrane protein YphA (DoxX/SURF4 family)
VWSEDILAKVCLSYLFGWCSGASQVVLRLTSVCVGSVGCVARHTSPVLDVIGTVARLGLAAVWLVSGAIKAVDPNQTYAAVRAYQILPAGAVAPVAAILPFLELAFGLLVLVGIGQRLMGVLSAALLLVYIAGVAQSWARGLTIDCGCFGGGGQVAAGQTQYPQEILRDIGFLALAVWLAVRPRSLFSVDGWLRRGRADIVDQEQDDADGPARSAVGRT